MENKNHLIKRIIKFIFLLYALLLNMIINSNSKHETDIYNSLINNNKHNKTKKTIENNNSRKLELKNLINKLNRNSIYRRPKYLIFIDFYNNPFCNDINAYLLFKHYIKINETNAVYVINNSSELYKSLLKKNKTKNLIPVKGTSSFYKVIYPYLLNSKIIVNSYVYYDIQKIVSNVKIFIYNTCNRIF